MISPADLAAFNAGVERARAAYAREIPTPIRPSARVCSSCRERRTAHESGQCLRCRRRKIPVATTATVQPTEGNHA